MKKYLPVLLPILFVFLVAIALRFAVSPLGFHVDIFSNAGWGEWIGENGPLGFYKNNIWVYSWPTQPPAVSLVYGFTNNLYLWFLEVLRQSANTIVKYHLAPGHMVWWFNFVIWFDNPLSTEIWYPYGYLISIKSIAILADIAIAGSIYWFAKLQKKNPIFWSAIYLFSPFTWYLSALWGQYDQIAYFLALSAFLLLIKWSTLSPLLMAASISMKPTTAFFLPLYLWIYFRKKPKLSSIVVGAATSLLFVYLSIRVFTTENIFLFIKEVLIPKILYKSEFRVSTNAYNFWHIFTLGKALNHNAKFLFLPAKIWGLMAFIFINIKSFKLTKKPNYKNILGAMFLVGGGSWLFLTNMLDRYFFAGIVGGLFVTIYNPKLFKYWLILSLIFWMNLFRSWWFPDFLSPLKDVMTANNGLAGLFLSIGNVVIYLKMAKRVLHKNASG